MGKTTKNNVIKKANYKFLSSMEFDYIANSNQLGQRARLNRLEKQNDENKRICESGKVKELTIEIEWKKSIYGFNPHATMRVVYESGAVENLSSSVSGCGYDKESSVIANMMNSCDGLRNMLRIAYAKAKRQKKQIPYGIEKFGFIPFFEGGVGMNSYRYGIFPFIGLELKNVASGNRYDVYVAKK